MGGWIKLYDKMLDWEWYGNTNVVRVFLHCLLKANYQQRVWQGITIQRGQFITSVASMSSELGLTPKQVRGALTKLQRSNNVAIKGANKYSVITICNYDNYQSPTDTEGQTKGRAKGKTKGQSKGAEKGDNNRNTYNTEIKEIQNNNENTTTNVGSTKFHKPTIDEIKEYIEQAGYYWIDADRFYNYYESNGWKVGRNAMKDWRATIRTWAAKDKPTKPETQDPLLPIQEDDKPRHILGVDDEYIQRMRKQVEEQRAGWAKS